MSFGDDEQESRKAELGMSRTSHQGAQSALGTIRIGIQRLAGRYTFHAKVLERFDIVPRPDVGTMGVTVSGNAVQLFFNSEFVEKIVIRELRRRNVFRFDLVAKIAMQSKSEVYVEPMMEAVEIDDNPHVFLAAMRALIAASETILPFQTTSTS